jgi:hypothetical protein
MRRISGALRKLSKNGDQRRKKRRLSTKEAEKAISSVVTLRTPLGPPFPENKSKQFALATPNAGESV